ncbi:uncharacterized protein LOC110842259 [Folsomia candida]|uniref:uncharacterized protein LOC110842259 n=1 Tax=Folsomia candida TaxID=158441 RepID=UPI001604A79A|nr:uncharacterized protein LOC110842259 [Folsomia candida]
MSFPPFQIWLYDRTLKNGDRVRHQGNDGSVCSTKKLITVQLLEQHHLHTYRDLDREVVTEVDYVDPPFPSSGTILPQLNEHTLQPVLKFQVGDSMMHKGWVGVVINGKVSITYRFANSGKMRMTSIRELSAMSGSKIYVGLQIYFLYLHETVLSHLSDSYKLGNTNLGIWSGGYRPYNRLTHGRHPATVTDVRVISLQVMWVDRILQRSCDTIATTKADDGNVVEVDSEPSPPPPTELEGESILSTVFRLADPSKELGVDSIVTVRWDDRLQKNEQSWRKTFLDDLSLGPQNVATFARIEDDEPSSKKLKAVKTPIPFSRLDWVACRVIFSQTMVDVLFDDNSVQYSIPSWKITAVLPHPRMGIPDMPYPDMGYELGDVVKNLVDFEHTHYTKYGFVLRTNPLKRTVDVNWVTVLELGKSPRVQIELKEMSQYDVQPVNSYLWLKMCPQIVLAKGIFEGVILEQSIPDAKIVVKCAEGPVKSVYLHELTFLQKKVYRSLADGIYEARTLEIRPDIIPFVDYCIPNAHSVFIHEDETVQRKYRFFTSASVPNDHTFYTSRPQFHIQTRTNGIINHEELNNLNIFKNYVERELQVLRGAVLSSVDQTGEFWPIFVERVGASSERWDLLTMAVIGAEGTVYEDIPFFLDIHLPFRFWEWEISRNPGLRPLACAL